MLCPVLAMRNAHSRLAFAAVGEGLALFLGRRLGLVRPCRWVRTGVESEVPTLALMSAEPHPRRAGSASRLSAPTTRIIRPRTRFAEPPRGCRQFARSFAWSRTSCGPSVYSRLSFATPPLAPSSDLLLFRLFAAREEAAIDLVEGALLIAAMEAPRACRVAAQNRRLDELAAAVRPRLSPGAPAPEALAALLDVFYRELGFRGQHGRIITIQTTASSTRCSSDAGGSPSASRWCWWPSRRGSVRPSKACPFPAHFLVRCAGPTAPLFVDPFVGRLIERGRAVGLRSPRVRSRRSAPPDLARARLAAPRVVPHARQPAGDLRRARGQRAAPARGRAAGVCSPPRPSCAPSSTNSGAAPCGRAARSLRPER
jgi:hypothetical protein